MLKQTIPTEMTEDFFAKYIESYIAMADTDKTVERTEIFLNKYPNEIRSIPKKFQDDALIMKQLIKANPLIGRYLEQDEILNLF